MSDHDAAQGYWRRASSSFIAGGDYYRVVDRALRTHVLPRVPVDARVLDIGCGDGTFTAVLAECAGEVDAFDLSPDLIEQARRRGLPNVRFEVGDATSGTRGSYGAVSCMGVLVCIPDEAHFRRVLADATAAVAPGGLLVLRETVSGWMRRVLRNGEYVACYRRPGAYLRPLREQGFRLEVDARLAVWSRWGRRSNHLWVLRAPGRPGTSDPADPARRTASIASAVRSSSRPPRSANR